MGKHNPMTLLITVKYATQPYMFDQENKVECVYRFEKTIKISSYEPNTNYKQQIKETLETILKSASAITGNADTNNVDTSKVAMVMRADEVKAPPLIMSIEEGMAGANEYVKMWFNDEGIFSL